MKKQLIKYSILIAVIIIGIVSIIIITKLNRVKTFEESIFNSNDNNIVLKLSQLSKEDSRVNNIIENYNKYPKEILEMLSGNIETIDFVLDYPEKKGQIYDGNIEEVKKGEYPLLLQWDKRWGYAPYGNSVIGANGCACAALSMVVVGLTGNNKITPYTIAKYSEKNGYYENVGTSWQLMTEGSKAFGVKGEEIPLSQSIICNSLKNGNQIICSMRKGDFTTKGHFIVLVGIEDGKIRVNDPNSIKKSNILWDYNVLKTQIKNLWSFKKI